MIRKFACVAACLGLGACGTLQQAEVGPLRIGETPAYATEASTRLVIERGDPQEPGRKILCSEPSPDISKALSAVISIGASKPLPGGAVSAQASAADTQAIVALAGRTAAVVALRDGLYRACEAYTNGLIGKDAYALVLANYSDLLVTLMLGEPSSTTRSNAETAVEGRTASPLQGAGAGAGGTGAPAGPGKGGRPGKGPGRGGTVATESEALAEESSRNAQTTGQPATKTANAPGPGAQAPSAAAEVAKLYFDSREDRSNRSVFVLCVSEAERARLDHRPFPDANSHNYIDEICASALAADEARLDATVKAARTPNNTQTR